MRTLSTRRFAFRIAAAAAVLGFLTYLIGGWSSLRTLDVQWTADGTVPWDTQVQTEAQGPMPIFLYQKIGNTYCYDKIYSETIRQRLLTHAVPTVKVTYLVTSVFGSDRSYSIRSVDGIATPMGMASDAPISPVDSNGRVILHSPSDRPDMPTPRCNR